MKDEQNEFECLYIFIDALPELNDSFKFDEKDYLTPFID